MTLLYSHHSNIKTQLIYEYLNGKRADRKVLYTHSAHVNQKQIILQPHFQGISLPGNKVDYLQKKLFFLNVKKD